MTWDWTPETLDALEGFLAERGILHGALTTRRIGDGHSNLTYLVTDGSRQVVLRRPPPPPTPPGAHDMLREAQLIDALRNSDVPVAEVLATAEAGDVINVPFYIMSFAAGPVITEETPSGLATAERRHAIGEALVDTLVALHAVDVDVPELAGIGKPEGFNRRHHERLARLVAAADGTPPAQFAEIDAWLRENSPPESGKALVHNDYRIGNVIMAESEPICVEAVLDWELATVGDPLIDVAYFLASVPDPGEPMTPTQEFAAAMLEDGYPSRDDLAARYAQRSGRDLTGLAWYTALVQWKLAILYEYGRRRAVRGVGDPYYADPAKVRSFLAAAHSAAGLAPPPELAQDEDGDA
jgi:aminoglycoside phosphotransferase (APT) family kinase protein